MRTPDVEVFPQDIKPGEEYRGYRYKNTQYSNCICWSSVIVNEDGVPLSWGKYPIPNNSEDEIICFFRDMTWDEEQEWYKNSIDMNDSVNQLNLIGIHNDLYSVGDAYHEMWNGWVGTNWREQLIELKNEEFFIVGVAPAPYGCAAISNPVALVAEYKDTGTRFWCHAAKHWIDDMREKSKEQYMAFC